MAKMDSIEDPDSQEGLALRCVVLEFRDELHGTLREASSAKFILGQPVRHVKEQVGLLSVRHRGMVGIAKRP